MKPKWINIERHKTPRANWLPEDGPSKHISVCSTICSVAQAEQEEINSVSAGRQRRSDMTMWLMAIQGSRHHTAMNTCHIMQHMLQDNHSCILCLTKFCLSNMISKPIFHLQLTQEVKVSECSSTSWNSWYNGAGFVPLVTIRSTVSFVLSTLPQFCLVYIFLVLISPHCPIVFLIYIASNLHWPGGFV